MSMLFAVILEYTVPLAQIDALRPAHRAYLDAYIQKGVFLLMGPQVPRTGGVILARCDGVVCQNRGDLETILSEDPFHQAGAATYTILAFSPSGMHPDLQRLITIT